MGVERDEGMAVVLDDRKGTQLCPARRVVEIVIPPLIGPAGRVLLSEGAGALQGLDCTVALSSVLSTAAGEPHPHSRLPAKPMLHFDLQSVVAAEPERQDFPGPQYCLDNNICIHIIGSD